MDIEMSGIGKEIYARRRDKLRSLMRARNLDALLVSLPANRFYLSGFELHDPQPNESAGSLIICADGRDWLATDARYETAAKNLWEPERVFIYRRQADLRRPLGRLGSIIGIETRNVNLAFFNALKAPGKGFQPAFVAADGLVEKLRVIKEPEEIDALKASFALNHKMFNRLAEHVAQKRVAGLSEASLAWDVEKFFRENGASELAFATIVATGPNAALPHAIPGAALIRENAPLLVDAGCRVMNYCSDQTRTFWPGAAPDAEFTKAYDLIRQAQEKAIAAIRPGVACSVVYETARAVFAQAGVEKAFTHSLGHGVGLETHEAPSLSGASVETLASGMAVTVEPGLYYPEWGGARLEYTVLVSEDGATIL